MQPQAVIPPKKSSQKRRLFGWLLTIALLSVVFWQRLNIIDWWLLRGYEPPVEVVALATDTTMTSQARKLFYINRPEVQEKAAFYQSCEDGETSVVLGCYKPPRGIFLLQVSDERLAGVEEVTAAHEMLHAAYDRLSDKERQRIGTLVRLTYKGLEGTPIGEKIALYEEAGADTTNELHSILGTEVANLPAELETHYAQYFSKRAAVVAFSDQYQAVFTARKQRVADLDKQLEDIEKQVADNNASLLSQEAAIKAESARLDVLLRNDQIGEYNQGVAAYNQSLVPYRSLLNQTRSLIAQYKTILDERNAVALEAQALGRALDSSIQTSVEER